MIARVKVTHHNPMRDPLTMIERVSNDYLTTKMELQRMVGFYILRLLGHSFSAVPGTKLVIEISVEE